MRPTIFVSFSVCMMLAASQLHASTETHPLQPSAPRTVTVSEADTPPQIRAGLLQSTLIVLPNEEKVANVFAGDTVNWIFDGGHVASRFISVKPKTANAATDIHIVSDHGNEYTLALREVSDDSDAHFDSKVFIAPGDQAAKDRLAQLPVFVPVAELDKAKQEAAAAKAAQEAELKAEETKAEQYRSEYPGSLHFDLRVGRAKRERTRTPANLARRQVHLSARPVPGNARALRAEGRERHRSSTSISTVDFTPCRSSWSTGIWPSANRKLNSIVREARSSHDRTESKYARHNSRAAGCEAAAQEEYAGSHRTGSDSCHTRHRQRNQLAARQQKDGTNKRAADASGLAQRAAGIELRDTAAVAGAA